MPSHTLTLVRRRLTLVLFRTLLRARGTTHRSAQQPHKHTSAHEWWHCQRLLCSTLFAVSFEGPTLPILSTPPPPIASSHLLMFFDTLEQLTPSFRSFFSPQSVHPYHYFSTSVCTPDLAMTIFILTKKTIQFSSFIYCILFYLILRKLEKNNWSTITLVFLNFFLSKLQKDWSINWTVKCEKLIWRTKINIHFKTWIYNSIYD